MNYRDIGKKLFPTVGMPEPDFDRPLFYVPVKYEFEVEEIYL